MSRSVLLTAAIEDTELFRAQAEEHNLSMLHYPLERYEAIEGDQQILDDLQLIEEYENIVYGSKRNARFFVEKIQELDKVDEVRNRLNLALSNTVSDCFNATVPFPWSMCISPMRAVALRWIWSAA